MTQGPVQIIKARKKEIARLIKRIEVMSDSIPETNDWGHVGDQGRIYIALEEILKDMGVEI